MAKSYLPEHILYEIFIRMPTKPLFRFKCVSKTCNRMISDPLFMKSRSPRRMIFLNVLQRFLYAIDNNSDSFMIKLGFTYHDLERLETINIIGSFNGIVILVTQHSEGYYSHGQYRHIMILYNPLTRESKMVPERIIEHYNKYVYGAGYGTTISDLKIVRIKNPSSSFYSVGDTRSFYAVFNLKDKSWSKPVELIRDYTINDNPGTFANGFLYWSAKTYANHFIILVLDLKKMVFSNIEIPGGHQILRLGTYNGQLCMISNKNGIDRSELWVMEEYGSGKLWSMVCSFKGVRTFSDVLCILDDGSFLMREGSLTKFVIYDMLKDSYKEVSDMTSFVRLTRLQASEYVESLISPQNICSLSSPSDL